MRACPACQHKCLKLKNIFTLKYACQHCGAECTTSTGHKAAANILINFLPVIGIVLAVVLKSVWVFLIGAILLPCVLCWWHQRTAQLHVIGQAVVKPSA